ncbi:BMP family ABC transporter substrate-binding protein [Actinoplanes sp. NPDC051851]|uniref:BMP family ABC transporter substrate-binding protein n=1 Tax=Actinoplanes sp. NPDC051851 TaxID=3154753 RepID=UPI0034173412
MSFRRKALAATAAGACLVTTASACSSAGSPSTGASGASDKLIVLVTPNPIGVNAFLNLSVEGAKAAATAAGATLKTFESTDPTSMAQNLQSAVDLKPELVITVSFSFDDAMAEMPVDYPDQQFLQIDSCPEKPAANLTCARFKEYESVYLAGVEAGLLSEKKKVGAVVALDTPFIRRFADPFGAGAQSVDSTIGFTPLFVGGNNPFSDPARANAQATTLGEDGADYVMASASAGNTGVFQAAKAGGFYAFGVDTNQCGDEKGVVVDNAIKRLDIAIPAAVEKILGGQPGGSTEYGLADGGVGLTGLQDDVATSGCLIADHPDVIAKVKEIQAKIISGEITVADPLTAK